METRGGRVATLPWGVPRAFVGELALDKDQEGGREEGTRLEELDLETSLTAFFGLDVGLIDREFRGPLLDQKNVRFCFPLPPHIHLNRPGGCRFLRFFGLRALGRSPPPLFCPFSTTFNVRKAHPILIFWRNIF